MHYSINLADLKCFVKPSEFISNLPVYYFTLSTSEYLLIFRFLNKVNTFYGPHYIKTKKIFIGRSLPTDAIRLIYYYEIRSVVQIIKTVYYLLKKSN